MIARDKVLDAYFQLERRFRRLILLDETAGVLGWDHAVIMPTGGAGARAEQRAELAVIRHEMLCDPALAELLERAEAAAALLDPWQAANLRQMRRRWRHATAVPAELVEAVNKASAASNMAWRSARKNNDFKAQSPHLARVVGLVREIAAAKAAAFGLDPYDALMDGYEAGLRRAAVEPLFAELEGFLPGLLEQVLERQAAAGPPLPLPGPFSQAAQKALGERLMGDLGFDFAHGRLDESHHPFTGGVKEDVRITTRYDE
ncbi:MAG TPA: carboxypeptidase M32, partial [Alphaproteobacteria bacterium]|nr:carboxypeptidase M32 [Alphaproteobacteria bacterium]